MCHLLRRQMEIRDISRESVKDTSVDTAVPRPSELPNWTNSDTSGNMFAETGGEY